MMLTGLFYGLIEVSLGCAVLIAILLLLSRYWDRFFAPKWNNWLWLLLSIRLLIPFSPFARINGGPLFPIVLWLLGCLLFLCYQAVSALLFRHSALRWSTPIDSPNILKMVQRISEETELDNVPPVVTGFKVASPMLIGLFTPVLILPHENYSEQDLQFILTHEFTHLKRHDIWYKLLLLFVNALHWFNPLVWFMVRKACGDLELACDEQILKESSLENRKLYRRTIANTLHAARAVQKPLVSTYFYGGSHMMRQRLKNILDTASKKSGAAALCAAVLLSIFSGTAVSALSGVLPAMPASAPVPRTKEQTASNDTGDLPDASPDSFKDAFIVNDTASAESAAEENTAEIVSSSADRSAASSGSSYDESASSSEESSSSSSSSEESSSEESSSEASSSDSSSSEESSSSSSENSSSNSSSDVSSSQASSAVSTKDPNVLPPKSAFVAPLQEIIAKYVDGTADTSRKTKPDLSPLPAGITSYPSISGEDFAIFRVNNSTVNGYGAMIPFDNGNYQMHIWLEDQGEGDTYDLVVTTVAFMRAQP